MNTEHSPFSLFVFFSVLVHGLLGTWYYFKPQAPAPVKPLSTLAISVGLHAAIAGATSIANPIEETPEPEPVKKPIIEPKNILPTAKPLVRKVVQKKPEPKKTVVKKPPVKKVVQKKPIQKPAQKTVTKPVQRPVPTKTVQNRVGSQGVNGSKAQGVKAKETGAGNKAGGGENKQAQFDFYVRQHLLARKVTPKSIRSRQKKGVVTVEFTLDKQGKLLSHKIVKSSKVREYNQAAMRLLKRAAPYPKAPSDLAWSTRKYTVDLTYEIN